MPLPGHCAWPEGCSRWHSTTGRPSADSLGSPVVHTPRRASECSSMSIAVLTRVSGHHRVNEHFERRDDPGGRLLDRWSPASRASHVHHGAIALYPPVSSSISIPPSAIASASTPAHRCEAIFRVACARQSAQHHRRDENSRGTPFRVNPAPSASGRSARPRSGRGRRCTVPRAPLAAGGAPGGSGSWRSQGSSRRLAPSPPP